MNQPVYNDILQCVTQAQKLIHARDLADHRLQAAFTALAGDEKVGLLAYVIWRGRAELLSQLRAVTAT